MALLSVNVNKLATLRNARGGNVPNIVQCSKDILDFGAAGITVHPRPDGRHIRTQDVRDLKKMLDAYNTEKGVLCEFNIEGYPNDEFMALAKEIRPEQCTLVPDPPDVITSNAGWKLAENQDFLKKIVRELKSNGSRVSLFIDVFAWSDIETQALKEIQADRVELYTERYAKSYPTAERDAVTAIYAKVARELSGLGYGINAGHDLSLENSAHLAQKVPEILEVSIGHALIAEALYLGFQETIKRYLQALK
jgi:pyridoxine 5-phosphate synthase